MRLLNSPEYTNSTTFLSFVSKWENFSIKLWKFHSKRVWNVFNASIFEPIGYYWTLHISDSAARRSFTWISFGFSSISVWKISKEVKERESQLSKLNFCWIYIIHFGGELNYIDSRLSNLSLAKFDTFEHLYATRIPLQTGEMWIYLYLLMSLLFVNVFLCVFVCVCVYMFVRTWENVILTLFDYWTMCTGYTKNSFHYDVFDISNIFAHGVSFYLSTLSIFFLLLQQSCKIEIDMDVWMKAYELSANQSQSNHGIKSFK